MRFQCAHRDSVRALQRLLRHGLGTIGHIPGSLTPPQYQNTRSKLHTVCCRVRRKRKRLASNGSIESDAAVS